MIYMIFFHNLSRSFSKDSENTSGISTLGYVDTIRNYSSKNSSSSILGYFSSDSFFPRFPKYLFLNSWKMPSQYVITIFAGFFLEVFSVRYSFRNFPKILAGMSLITLAQIPSRSFLLIYSSRFSQKDPQWISSETFHGIGSSFS